MQTHCDADLILAINQLINECQDENNLSLSLINKLTEILHAELAVMAFPLDTSFSQLDLRAVRDRAQLISQFPKNKFKELLFQSLKTPLSKATCQTLPLKESPLYYCGFQLNTPDPLPGAILIARLTNAFSEEEISLLKVTAGMIENALRYFKLSDQFDMERLALQTILKIDRIRDTSETLDELINRSLSELCQVVPASAGFIMIYDRKGIQLELRGISDKNLLTESSVLQKIEQTGNKAIVNGSTYIQQFHGDSDKIHTILGVPLILEERLIGVLGLLYRTALDTFKAHDQQLIEAISSQMDTAIFERLQTQALRTAFGRNVGPDVMERLLQIDDRDLLKCERTQVSALFCDMRGFTSHAESLGLDDIEKILNQHLAAMVAEILDQDGMLDKFLGDGIMALYNVPAPQEDYAYRAICTALKMQAAHQKLMKNWQVEGLPGIPIGIGIATGIALTGNFGSSQHAEYTAIGQCVNRSARLCGAAAGNQVWVDEDTYQLVKDKVEAEHLKDQALKGFSDPVKTYLIHGLK